MLSAVLNNPGKVSRLPKFLRAVENMNEFRLTEGETPDYFDELVHAQLPAMRNGKPLFITPDLPISDLARLNRKDILSSMNPFAKSFFEDIPTGGSNFFTGASLERFPGEEDETVGMDKRTLHVISAILPPIGRFVRAKRAIERDEFLEFIASEFTGVKFRAIDVRRVVRGARFREEQIARQFKQRIVSAERKARQKTRKERREKR